MPLNITRRYARTPDVLDPIGAYPVTRCLLSVVVGLAAAANALAADPPRFEWKDGDRVVMIGDTLIERDQQFGYLETLITAQNREKSITFRNLGWSGDTVFGHAQAGFGKPADGFKHVVEHVNVLKPTVLILGYGMAESFDGPAGLDSFVAGYHTLLDAVTAATKPRLIFLSPIAHEDLGRPLPDPAKHNANLERYRDAIRKLAEERGGWFIDLYDPTLSARDYDIGPLTTNGIHPSAFGFWYLGSIIDVELRQLKRDNGWDVRVDAGKGRLTRSALASVTDVEKIDRGVRFTVTDQTLPVPSAPRGAPKAVIWLGAKRTLAVTGLTPGLYTLKIDGQPIMTLDDNVWVKGVRLETGPEYARTEALREAIVAKNRLYFYRWRPQNETYLFGFRKHEQGNNAREIPQFDPLVAEKEAEIARLKTPSSHVYEMIKENEVVK